MSHSSSVRARGMVFPAIAMLCAAAPLSAALAGQTCSGSLRTSLIHPLPKPMTVTLQPAVQDSANPQLTQQFANGLQSAGVALSPQGNMTLNLAVSLTAAPSAPAGAVSGRFKGFDWVSGEPVPGQSVTLTSANLTLGVTLADNAQSTQSWIASLTCVVRGNDSAALARELGEIVGRSIGTEQSDARF